MVSTDSLLLLRVYAYAILDCDADKGIVVGIDHGRELHVTFA